MSQEVLKQALDLHLDRLRDSTVTILRAIIDDPRLKSDQRGELLIEMIREHKYISAFLEDGVMKALQRRDGEFNVHDKDH